jgi:hypothetical protein
MIVAQGEECRPLLKGMQRSAVPGISDTAADSSVYIIPGE